MLLYTTTCIDSLYMCFYLQRDLIPGIKTEGLNEDDVWMAIANLSQIKDLGERANQTASKLPEGSLKTHLLGFKAIINEVMNDTCNWVSH